MILFFVVVRKAALALLLMSLLVLFLALPVAQAQVPTKTPILPASTEEPPSPSPVATQNLAPTLEPTAVTEEGSASQLSLGRPLLGMELLEFLDSPTYVYESSMGGGDLLIDLGGDCLPGYTSTLATLGLVLTDSTGPIQIGFETVDSEVPVSIIIWEDIPGQWWCNIGFVDDNYFEFSTIGEGIYFVWVLTESPQAVSGNMFVWDAL